jgi:hypothetical protein
MGIMGRMQRGNIEMGVRIADRLYAARRSLRSLWGEQWRERLRPYMAAVEEAAGSRDQVLPTVLKLCKRMPRDDAALLPTLAAAVELLDPLQEQPRRHGGCAVLGRRTSGG